jgi:predicted alpha/beta hydrolase family esterase
MTNDETIIIGHSSGAVEVLSLLQHLPEDKKVKAVFLVSAFRDDLGWDALTDLFTEPFDFEIIRTKADNNPRYATKTVAKI